MSRVFHTRSGIVEYEWILFSFDLLSARMVLVKENLSETNSEEELERQEIKKSLLYFLIRQLPRLIISLTLFIGGIIILSLRISGWGLFLGLPATQVGLIFLIFTFDEIAKRRVGPQSFHLLSCSVCGQPTPAPSWQKEKVCEECQSKIAKKLKGGKN